MKPYSAEKSKMFEKVTQFSGNFGFFRNFLLMFFFSYFQSELRQKILISVIILCLILFACIMVQVKPTFREKYKKKLVLHFCGISHPKNLKL